MRTRWIRFAAWWDDLATTTHVEAIACLASMPIGELDESLAVGDESALASSGNPAGNALRALMVVAEE